MTNEQRIKYNGKRIFFANGFLKSYKFLSLDFIKILIPANGSKIVGRNKY
jgi:hypothetical protein